MYIKRLEIVGFKSFPERVLVPLSQGISAVVGPNGCGKSNIIDAIRWVMGEQSPRMLRGRNMDDVLFNGSLGRPASALAEVTLTLARDSDPDRGFPTAAETSVTRRLYRSGDSEYLINRVACRLKDVVHFFTDHGVGTRAYGIIEQGRVGWLVDARPEERRGLIDEAAGITRYKQQKKEAERKIESSEANLANVSVIKAETKKQLDQVTKAAAKAARFKALKEELRELDLILSARSLTKARVKRREILSGREENKRLLISLLAEADRHDLDMENIKLAVAQVERELEEKTAAWHRLTSARDSVLKEVEFYKNNLARAEERRVQTLGELGRISAERRRKLEEEAALTAELAALTENDVRARQKTGELREEWLTRKTAYDDLNRRFEAAERERAAREREAAGLAAELAGAESLLTHHNNRLAELAPELAEAAQKAEEAGARLAALSAQKEQSNRELESAREEALYLAESSRAAEREAAEAAARTGAAESRLTALSARLRALEEVKSSFGWYPTGVKALMAAPELAGTGLIGPLAEYLAIPDGFEDAVEAALGERLAWVLVENRAAALRALNYLEDNNLGRCGFLLRDALTAENYDLARSLLGDFQLTESLLDEAEATGAVLTRKGQYAGAGLVAGGGRTGNGEAPDAGLLARLKEVEALSGEAEAKTAELDRCRARQAEAEETFAQTREAARAAESAAALLLSRLAEIDKNMALAGSLAAQAESRQSALAAEESKSRQESEKLTASLAAGRLKRAEAWAAAEAGAGQVADMKDELNRLSEDLDEVRLAGEEARAAAAQAAAGLDRGRHALTTVAEWLGGVEDNLAARESEISALGEEMDSYRQDLADLESRAGEFPARIEAAGQEQAEARRRLETERLRQEGRERESREVRRRREDLNAIINGQETDLVSLNFSVEKIEEDLRRDWRIIMIDPDEPRPDETGSALGSDPGSQAESLELQAENASEPKGDGAVTEEPSSGGTAEEIDLEDGPLQPLLESLNPLEWLDRSLPQDAAQRRDSLRSKIGSLGEVSLGAIEKEAELRAEYERYQTQFDDLTKAISDLKDSIDKINYTCKIRFAETFQAVDEKFREIFPILFEGGEGWISLTDDRDPLESGVEIHVHPPGKKVLVMSLLSGGEKALTALALIFALYLIKPSPFCLLDETDAPLDEANIDRFNRLLRQLSRASQIIMVTHNKRTMQTSHTLYGVTMETPGVSKLVSVNLAEAEALTTDV